MQYKILNIGKVFTKSAISTLEASLSEQHSAGYRFHSVMEITQPGCLNLGQPSTTYLAIFERI